MAPFSRPSNRFGLFIIDAHPAFDYIDCMGQISSRKRIFLINRDFQFRFVRLSIVFGLISSLLTGFLILFPLYKFEILVIPRFLPTPIMALMGVAILVNIASMAMLAVVVSHRIAGPIYSLTRELRKLERGEYASDLKTREQDELKYLIRTYNGMIAGLRDFTKSDLERLSDIEAKLEKSLADGGDRDQIISAVHHMRASITKRFTPGDEEASSD